MTAFTDDERRRVAERLRCAAEQRQPYTQPTLACFIGADCVDIWTRLADLIEPSCDRDALLALAKEADESADGIARYIEDSEGCFDNTDVWEYERRRDFARRIREACGVVA